MKSHDHEPRRFQTLALPCAIRPPCTRVGCRVCFPLASEAMDGVEHYHREMEAAWDYVDANYRADEILGERGSQIVLRLAARASHHEMPYAMSVLAGLVGCTNGASIEVFACGDAAPVSIAFLNVNLPQTRKSQITNAITKLGKAVDRHTLDRVKDALQQANRASQDTQPVHDPRIWSSTLTSFTEAAFFQRCAGDWNQVEHPEPVGELRGRFHYSTLLNVDEAYKFLKMIGLVSQSSSGDKKVDASAVPDAASEFNKLMQSGHSALVTKTAGTFGDGSAPHVNVAGVGNVHPSMWIPVERCEAGTNHVAVKERLLVGTGRPVEPHHSLPPRLQTESGFKRWVWSPLLRVMVEPLGLPSGTDDPARAAEMFERVVVPVGEGSDDEGEQDADFVPDAKGYRITLVDGCVTRLRFRRLEQDGARLFPEFRVANRDVSVPAGQDLTAMADRVLHYFNDSHMDIPWTPSARTLHKGFSAVFSANTAVARGDGEVAKSARLGAAPWHLSNLSTALLVFEIAVGEHADTELHRNRQLPVQDSHVTRGYKLLSFLHGISACWAAHGAGSRASQRIASQDLAAASRRLSVPGAAGQLPRSQFGTFALTQAAPGDPPPAAEEATPAGAPSLDAAANAAASDLHDAAEAAAGDVQDAAHAAAGDLWPSLGLNVVASQNQPPGPTQRPASPVQPHHGPMAREEDLPPAQESQFPGQGQQAASLEQSQHRAMARAQDLPPAPSILQIGDCELPVMQEGYGDGGASVQDPMYGAVLFSDREVMQKTLLRGEAVIFGRQVIDCMSVKKRRTVGSGYTKESVKLAHWKAVMQAGLAKHRVGVYDSGASCPDFPNQPRIRLDLPPDDQAELREEYHNRLMMLCQLPYVKLTESILKRHQKSPAPRAAGAAPAGSGQEGVGRGRPSGRRGAAAGARAAAASASAATAASAPAAPAMPVAARFGADA